MSALPDRHAVDDRPAHGNAVSGVLASARRGASGALERRPRGASAASFRGLLASGAPASLPVPSVGLALGALGAYAVVVIGAEGLVGVGLASIPLFIAAALLPARSAIATGAATIALTLIPAMLGDVGTVAELAMIAELTLLVSAALALRAAVVRLDVSRTAHTERVVAADEQLQDRVRTVLAIAERMTRTFDQAEIFETVVAETQRVLGADGVTIRIVQDELLQVVAWAGISADVAHRLPTARPGEWWFSEAVRAGRAWACDDAAGTLRGPTRRLYDTHAAVLPFAADLVVPLYGHDRVMGAISVLRTAPYHWQTSDIEFVAALATHASIAISNAELFDRAETRALQMSVLQAASARMSRQNTIESVGRAIVEETRGIIDYHNARVYVLEPPDTLEPIAFEGTVGEYEKVDMELLRTKLGVGFTGWTAEHGQPLLIHDANADPRGSTIPGTDDVDESMLVVPMRYDERVTGAITLSKLGLHQFDEEDLRLLTILADQAATAVESARLLARTQGLAGELRRLLDMGSELAHSLDSRKVADLIARHVANALAVDQAAISFWDRPGDRLLTWGYFPIERPDDVLAEYALAGFPATRRVLDEQIALTVDVDDPESDVDEATLLRIEGNHSMLMLPLVAKGAAIGLVEVISRTPMTFDAARIALVRTMANEAAMALENAKLYEDARELADHDQLTGFHNHRYLHERLGEEIVRSQRSGAPLSLLMLDLDDFKLVNDTFGHLFGDRVLVWTAELIRSVLRGSDMPARYGGDEFAVILPDTDARAASMVARRMVQAFRDRPYESESRGSVPVTASIGVATYQRDGRTGQELIAAADQGLYRVKAAGGHGSAGPADGRGSAGPADGHGAAGPADVAASVDGVPASVDGWLAGVDGGPTVHGPNRGPAAGMPRTSRRGARRPDPTKAKQH